VPVDLQNQLNKTLIKQKAGGTLTNARTGNVWPPNGAKTRPKVWVGSQPIFSDWSCHRFGAASMSKHRKLGAARIIEQAPPPMAPPLSDTLIEDPGSNAGPASARPEYGFPAALDVTKPYKFMAFGALDATKPYKFIRFGALDVTTPYRFMEFGAMDVTKPYKFIGFGPGSRIRCPQTGLRRPPAAPYREGGPRWMQRRPRRGLGPPRERSAGRGAEIVRFDRCPLVKGPGNCYDSHRNSSSLSGHEKPDQTKANQSLSLNGKVP
jgi:hypothetical protein